MKNIVMHRIYSKAPMQRKKIDRFFAECPDAERELDNFLKVYKSFFDKEGVELESVVDSYLEMIDQIIHARLEFIRTGCYPVKYQETALAEIYSNRNTMQQYMLGLALSYFLWSHHFQLLCYYREIIKAGQTGRSFLEVGCGHGLFLVELLMNKGRREFVDVVDISAHSIEMTKSLLETVLPEASAGVKFHHCDVFRFEAERSYDLITLGEVLEHVDDPLKLLSALAGYLAPDGRMFVTTCANCPAIDHVFHFKDVQEIRKLIEDAGLTIESELIAPSERRSMHDMERLKIDISFAAVLSKVDS